ncbi:Ribosomal protein L11 methyltransferase [hydrothermal vent metagenome]|uniref:Ribosomal protein L11 methyltransferase n=1 Tax=hydrothermal vent metagenome TaxID=652676 RepID=A0A1W1CFI4_9ZZZZ
MEEGNYYELTMTLNHEYIEFIADFVANIYGEGIEIGRDNIIIRSENDVVFIQGAVEALIETLGNIIDVKFKIEEKQNIDWIKKYQESIEPIEAGKFYIYPSWFKPKENKINIKIDPALAFGSGHHATTHTCLDAIGEIVKQGDEVLDVGCGSGILGLASTKLGATVDLCDTDPLSVKSCEENFILNNETYNKLWEGSANQIDKEYDIVIANIIADVLRFISSDLIKATKREGTLILSGILDTKLELVLPSFKKMKLVEQKQKDEWVTLIYYKESNE